MPMGKTDGQTDGRQAVTSRFRLDEAYVIAGTERLWPVPKYTA